MPILKYKDGSIWKNAKISIDPFKGATSSLAGAEGSVPAPIAGQQNYVLSGAGTWTPVNNVIGILDQAHGGTGTNDLNSLLNNSGKGIEIFKTNQGSETSGKTNVTFRAEKNIAGNYALIVIAATAKGDNLVTWNNGYLALFSTAFTELASSTSYWGAYIPGFLVKATSGSISTSICRVQSGSGYPTGTNFGVNLTGSSMMVGMPYTGNTIGVDSCLAFGIPLS